MFDLIIDLNSWLIAFPQSFSRATVAILGTRLAVVEGLTTVVAVVQCLCSNHSGTGLARRRANVGHAFLYCIDMCLSLTQLSVLRPTTNFGNQINPNAI